jgi:large conductance mechanosensitive channel
MEGFKKFILRGNVVDLAVAVVIGAAFGAVVTSFVKAFITPLLGIFGGIPDFSGIFFTVNGSRFLVGEFINALLSFVLIAVIVYFLIIMPLNRLSDLRKKEAEKEDPLIVSQRELTEAIQELNVTMKGGSRPAPADGAVTTESNPTATP